MKKRFRACLVALAAGTVIGCDSPAGPNGGDSAITATIDGQQWKAATTPGATIAMRLTPNNLLSVTGTDQALRSVNLTIQGVTGPGTYQLSAVPGAIGSVTEGGSGQAVWLSSLSGGSGTTIITVLNAERVAGTFAFTAVPAPGNPSSATVQVTNGQFDMAWTGQSGF